MRGGAWRPAIGSHDSFLCGGRAAAVPVRPRGAGVARRVLESDGSDDHGPTQYSEGERMSLSRRKLLFSGIAVTAGASGLAVAARLARKYGLVPPDAGGIYGVGETLSYASQRLFAKNTLAPEFSRAQISARPFPN